MKNVLLIAILFGSFACTQTPSYKVNVKLTSAEGKAYLSNRIKGEWIKLDSVELVNGEAQFKGVVKYPDIRYLSVNNNKEKVPFFMENSVISITGSLDSLTAAKVSGSTVHHEYRLLQDNLDKMDKQATVFSEQSKEAEKADQKVKADSLMTLSDQVFTSIDDQQKDFIKAHPASCISPYLLSRVSYDMESDMLEGILKGMDAKLDSLPTVIMLKERAAKLKTVSVGQITPDFTMNDVNGVAVKLSDIYAKNDYTLIDFWASWCGDCRGENPNVVATFNKYKSKGFDVMGVSLDSDKANWLKAIADDHLTWTHVSDLNKWKNGAAVLYLVNSIPSNVLVDKTGKIIARNIRKAKLRDTMAGLLK